MIEASGTVARAEENYKVLFTRDLPNLELDKSWIVGVILRRCYF